MLEGNIFNSGGHGSNGGKRLLVVLVAVAGVIAASLAAGEFGGVIEMAASGQGGAASGADGSMAASGFPEMAAGFVFLLVGMLVVILRM